MFTVCLHVWQFVYITLNPCSFSTLFCVAVATHVTACDVRVTPRWNCKIMRQLSYKSSFAKTSVSVHSEASVSGLKEVTLSFYSFFGFIMMLHQALVRQTGSRLTKLLARHFVGGIKTR